MHTEILFIETYFSFRIANWGSGSLESYRVLNAVVTREIKLFQNYFRGLMELTNIFEHVQCRRNNFEITPVFYCTCKHGINAALERIMRIPVTFALHRDSFCRLIPPRNAAESANYRRMLTGR